MRRRVQENFCGFFRSFLFSYIFDEIVCTFIAFPNRKCLEILPKWVNCFIGLLRGGLATPVGQSRKYLLASEWGRGGVFSQGSRSNANVRLLQFFFAFSLFARRRECAHRPQGCKSHGDFRGIIRRNGLPPQPPKHGSGAEWSVAFEKATIHFPFVFRKGDSRKSHGNFREITKYHGYSLATASTEMRGTLKRHKNLTLTLAVFPGAPILGLKKMFGLQKYLQTATVCGGSDHPCPPGFPEQSRAWWSRWTSSSRTGCW